MSLRPLATAVHRLARSPRLVLAAVACIAIGTAATSAALTLVSATLLEPLPFPEAERLVRVWLAEPEGDERIDLSYPDLVDLGAGVEGLDRLEATARARLLLQNAGPGGLGARRVEGEAVTPGYFALLGVEPLVGRLFTAEEHRPGGEPVVLLAHRTWGLLHDFDPGAVGTTLATDRGVHTIVGVLPPSFSGSVEEDSGDIELWLPIADYLSEERRARRDVGGIWTLGKLAPGATVESLGAELDALGRRLAAEHPDSHAGRRLVAEPLGENWRSRVRGGSLLLLAASLLLLLVAATNVGVLLLARAVDDRRELAIRAALGASRGRMLGQILLETALVVAAGGLAGLWLGPVLLRRLLADPDLVDGSRLGLPVFVELGLDPRAAALSVLVMAGTALVAGLGPALLAARTEPGEGLQEAGRGALGSRRSRRWTSALVLAEVALTMVLLVGASLLARSYAALADEELGFRTEGVLRIALFVDPQDVADDAALAPFYDRVTAALAAEPGVADVGAVWPTVPIDWPREEPVRAPGLAPAPTGPGAAGADGGLRAGVFLADDGFFRILEIPLIAGRGFTAADRADAPPVALVDRGLAERLAAGGPIERTVGTEITVGESPVRVVGVVGDTRYGGPRQEPGAGYEVYLPLAQDPRRLTTLIVDAGAGDPSALVPPLSRRLAALAPASALDWVGPLDGWVADLYLLDNRFLLELIALFAGAGLLLSAFGLYAVLADSVVRRRGEIGVRQALGATPRAIVSAFVARALRLVAGGLGAGAVLAWASTRLLDSAVHGVAPTDPVSFAAAAGVLGLAALLASALPARRAAAVDPAATLREE